MLILFGCLFSLWMPDELGPFRKQNRLFAGLELETLVLCDSSVAFLSLSASVFEFAWVTSRGVVLFPGEKQILRKITMSVL